MTNINLEHQLFFARKNRTNTEGLKPRKHVAGFTWLDAAVQPVKQS